MNNKLVILSVAALSLTACKKEAPKQDGPKPYPVVNVEAKNIVGYQTFPATIQGKVIMMSVLKFRDILLRFW
jgi:membrane fusion protein (multidrug efflux system)